MGKMTVTCHRCGNVFQGDNSTAPIVCQVCHTTVVGKQTATVKQARMPTNGTGKTGKPVNANGKTKKKGSGCLTAIVIFLLFSAAVSHFQDKKNEPTQYSGDQSYQTSQSASDGESNQMAVDTFVDAPVDQGYEIYDIPAVSAPYPDIFYQFYDGYAVVPLKNPEGDALTAIIDTSGQILSQHPQYRYEENASGQSAGTEMFLTPVRDGHAVKQIKGEYFFLCDVYGNVVCQSEGDDVWQIWGSDSDYILVRRYVETLERSETVYGLLDFQGNWVVNINTNPIYGLPLATNTLVFSNAFAYAKALNEDVILIGGDFLSENDVLYRISTGQWFSYYIDDYLNFGTHMLIERSSGTRDYVTYLDLTDLTQEGADWELEEHPGVDFGASVSEDLYLCGNSSSFSLSGYYDLGHNLAINLDDLDLRLTSESGFHNGYAILYIRNDQNSVFYTVIDTAGNRQFEPRLLDSAYCTVMQSDNVYYHISPEGNACFDQFGNTFNEAELADVVELRHMAEHLALMERTDGLSYVDATTLQPAFYIHP